MQKISLSKILLALLIVISPESLIAQDFALQKKLSFNFSNVSLTVVLEEITKICGASFSYNPDKIDVSKKIDIRADNQTVGEILQALLPSMDLEFMVIEDKIVIKKMKGKATEQSVAEAIKLFTLSGFIKDSSNGEALIGAGISLPGTTKGSGSNEYGFYSFQLPEGKYEVYYSFLGYQMKVKSISLYSDTRLSMDLTPLAKDIEEVKISANGANKIVESTQTSESLIRAVSIIDMPAFMGEQDVIKSLQTIPGIKFCGDGSTLFYVRGGNRDQNLILVDEAVLYNPSHMLGLFSSLSPGAINSIKVFKGDIPAEYGGRLSSLIDIKTREGNQKKFHFSGNTGFFATSLNFEGPFSKNKSSYFISARRSQLEWIFRKKAPSLRDLYFSDINIKLNFRLNNNNRIYFSTYGGNDKYLNGTKLNSSGIQWENVASTLRWNHIFSESLFSNTSFTGSRYDYDFITSTRRSEMWNSHISNFTLKSDFTWYHKSENTMKFGFLIGNFFFNPGNFESGVNSNTGVPKVPQKNTREKAFYYSSEQEINDKISLKYGVRLSVWHNLGEAIEVEYNENRNPVDTTYYSSGVKYNTYRVLEPRISCRYMITNLSSVKIAFTRTSQYVNLLSNSISPFTSMEVWLPASINIKPQVAEQFVAGYQQIFSKEKYTFSIEGFYKKMHNQLDYTDHAQMLFNPYIEGELRFGTSLSTGIEVMLSKTSGLLTGWLAYTLSTTRMRFEDLNNGNEFPASYDRPHEFSIVGQYMVKPRWQISANWIIMSGGAYTAPSGFYIYNNYQVPIYETRNNLRLPVYHRLDLATEIRLNKPGAKSEHKLKFSLFNAYARHNPIAINYNKINDDTQSILVPLNHGALPDLVTTMTYLFTVVPSLSYSFIF